MKASYRTYASILETYAPGQIQKYLSDRYGNLDQADPEAMAVRSAIMAEQKKAAAEAQKNNQPRQCPSWEVYGKADTTEQRTPGILYRWTWT